MQGYILKIAYKGTAYCGWQVQPNKPTVQATVQAACEKILGSPLLITGCSRTDSGVHALGFVATVCGENLPTIPVESLPAAINTALPNDIAVLESAIAPEGFHPRYDALGKEYVYRIHNSRIRNPFTEETTWHFPKPLSAEIANELCSHFVGRHNFASFMAAGSKITDTVREIKYFKARREGDEIIFTVAADGFLYNMVRIMVGTVAERAVGGSGMDIPSVIASKNRSNAGITAPAKGLTLNKVFYDKIF